MSKVLIFDFDGTLTPYPLTKLGVLEEIGFIGGTNNFDFIKLVKERMDKENINIYESFYKTIFNVLEDNGYILNDKNLSIGAKDIEYNKGIYEFLEHFYNKNISLNIISSGMKVFLDNTLIAKFFNKIYGTTFVYKNREIVGIDNLVTDNKKIDILLEIINGRSISDVMYFGDGLTDIPIMEYIKSNGGTTIYVYDKEEDIANINIDAVSYFFNKNYSKDGQLFSIVEDLVNN